MTGKIMPDFGSLDWHESTNSNWLNGKSRAVHGRGTWMIGGAIGRVLGCGFKQLQWDRKSSSRCSTNADNLG